MAQQPNEIGPRRYDDLVSEPWKNGRGILRSLARAAPNPGGDPPWTINLADVNVDGAYSSYPGRTRWSMVLTGQGVDLSHAGTTLSLRPFQLVAYDGEPVWDARLVHGPMRVLNVIVEADRYEVEFVTGGYENLRASDICVALTVDAQATYVSPDTGERIRINPGEFVVFSDRRILQTLRRDSEAIAGPLICVAIRHKQPN